jgi:hypothetical protein
MPDLVCQVAGIIMILGAIFLLFKEKIYLNAETKQPISVEVPFFGKLRVNSPAFGVFFLGVVAVAYPVHFDHTNYVKVIGKVKSNTHPVIVYVASSQSTVGNGANLEVALPQLSSKDYTPYIILVAGNALDYEPVPLSDAKNGVISIGSVELIDSSKQLKSVDVPTPEGFLR